MAKRRMSTLGARIRMHRERKGMVQADLANAIGVRLNQVSKWERDLEVPRLDNAIKLADVFGISLNELVGRQ